jgi:signal transduction histidine kinase
MLELSGVTVDFGERAALADVDLRVEAGELVVLSGEPGSGKTALVRCIGGDLAPDSGEIRMDGRVVSSGLRAAARCGIAVVWQDLAFCADLDVANNLLLGRETRAQLLSGARFHAAAAQQLAELGIEVKDTEQIAGRLPAGQQRLLALAMALARKPRLLVLDEPTLTLGSAETRAVERRLVQAKRSGLGVLLTSRDIGQMFRIADAIVVLRHGKVAANIDPLQSHPDEVAGVLAGGRIGDSARRQLALVHGLADSLARADPTSGLALIISALAAALNIDRERVKVLERNQARAATAADISGRVIVRDGAWMVPVPGLNGPSAWIAVDQATPSPPSPDELELLVLYASYASAAIERRESELAQREAAALRRSRELQRQFLSRLGHELRTPLTAIRGYATSLAAPDIVWDDDSEQRFLGRIADESARLGRLVDDLLDFSAIESDVMRLSPGWCDLRLVAQAAVDCLPYDWPSRVAVAGETPVIWADHDRIEQVFVNLISNGLQHNPEGTRVSVSMHALDSSRVEIVVADDGPGLPPELRAAPFDQTGRPHSRTAGAGLGLSIARGIVETHSGTIELVPDTTGTAFKIILPIESSTLSAPTETSLADA